MTTALTSSLPEDPTLPLLISFSGGRTSAYMTKYLVDKYPTRERVIVFANTGREREETLQFVHECDTRWNLNVRWIETVMGEYRKGATFRIVNYTTASRNGEPFEDVIKKHGIPNSSAPHCSREMKSYPIKAYAKWLGWKKYETAIGFRADEPERINRIRQKVKRHYYPLVDEHPVTKPMIDSWWSRQEFDLILKNYQGNCDLCWKKSTRKLLTLILVERNGKAI